MKRFNMKRFRNLSVWMLLSMRRNMLTNFVTLGACYFLIYAIAIWNSWERIDMDFHDNIKVATALCIVAMNCAMFVFYTQLFSNMKTKEQRIRYMMLPASELEKYLARLLYVVIILPLVAIIAFLAVDALLSFLAMFLSIPYKMSGCGQIWEYIMMENYNFNDYRYNVSAYWLIGFCVMLNAYVLLCGTLFRRPLIMSITSLLAIIVFFIVTLTKIKHDDISFHLEDEEMAVLFLVLGTISLGIAALMIWASYAIFRRMQVIHNKWINI